MSRDRAVDRTMDGIIGRHMGQDNEFIGHVRRLVHDMTIALEELIAAVESNGDTKAAVKKAKKLIEFTE